MKKNILKESSHRLIFLDGSTGTMLQKHGMPAGIAPEKFCMENPGVLTKIQREYFAAGSHVVLTPTFGANRIKLKNYGLEKRVGDVNSKLAEITLENARKYKKLVAGDLGPTGVFFKPFGEKEFEEGLAIYSEQVKLLSKAGVDLLMIETQIDIQEARIALLAAKENCKLPVMVSMSFDEKHKTLTGSDPLSCLNILQSLGADAFGINCSLGPDKILPMVEEIYQYAKIPILIKPNAGLPIIQNGKTVFPLSPDEFAKQMEKFLKFGIFIFGGCCGTTPQHIKKLVNKLRNKKNPKTERKNRPVLLLSSSRKTIFASSDMVTPIRIIGERINPTGKKELQESLKKGGFNVVKKLGQRAEKPRC